MNNQTKIAAFTLVLSTFVLQPTPAPAQGSLTPPGAPAPTMKSLDELDAKLEKRTPISAAPYTISNPGSYYLTANILVAVNNGIVIAANNVTLDLNGFAITSIQNPAGTGKGIALGSGNGPVTNVTILNGFITGGVTNNAGTFSGPGFGYGIFQFGGPASTSVQVSRVTVSGCRYVGVNLGTNNTAVDSCNVTTAGTYGIVAGMVRDSTAVDCGTDAIVGDQIIHCRGQATGTGYAIYGNNVIDSYGFNTTGYGIFANIAENCYGTSTSGTGLNANYSAQNCVGQSGSGTGLAAKSALNCYGYSAAQTGLYGQAVENSSGFSDGQSGTGIYAQTAVNCYGINTTSGIGVYVFQTATGCYGKTDSGTGLYAFIANVCHGEKTAAAGIAINYTHNVNSF